MRSRKHQEQLVQLLGEVKFAEKQLEKLRERLPASEALIKKALLAGERERAKECALKYEELKAKVREGEQKVALAKRNYELGKQRSGELASAEAMAKLTAPLGAMADSMNVLGAADDMLRKLEEDAALNEARLDMALEEQDASPEPLPPPDLPGQSAEDILREFEGS